MNMQEKINIIVTRPKGSWRWQNAYAISTYVKSPNGKWRFLERGPKFAWTSRTNHLFESLPFGRGALKEGTK
jgi:hypothetical protein